MENTILQLIKIITALFYNDLATDDNPILYEEIDGIIVSIKTNPRATASLGDEETIIDALRYTAEWMLSEKRNFSKEDLLQRLKINLQGNTDYHDVLEDSLNKDILPEDARLRVTSIMKELRFGTTKDKVKKIISVANAKINFGTEYIALPTFIEGVIEDLSAMHAKTSGSDDDYIGGVNFTANEEIENALTKGVGLASSEGLLNVGLQGINEFSDGGVPRGFLVNVGGLTADYKSGMLNDFSLFIPAFNDPWMWDNTKKPMHMHITLENTIDQNIMLLYKKLYALKYSKECNPEEINIGEAIEELKEWFHQRGYTVQMLHYNPTNFTIADLIDVLNKYIAAGYEIHSLVIDYLPLFAHNTFGDRNDLKIQRTYEQVRLFCYERGITVFTGCQLSTEAQNECKVNSVGFVKKVSTGGWYMDCRSLHTKLDLEIVTHIHHHLDGYSYLFIGRGKRRLGQPIPQYKKFPIYQFDPIKGIIPDGLGKSTAIYKLPSVMDASENNVDWG